jgi:hypothetical protein
MGSIIADKPSKSAKIRALDAAGYARADIAAYLRISYQHVHSVLGRTSTPAAKAPSQLEAGTPSEEPSGATQFDGEGRVVLPPEAVAALQRTSDSPPMWRVDGDNVVIMGRQGGLRWAQELVAKYSAGDTSSWTDQLIAERRAEAAREDDEARSSGG